MHSTGRSQLTASIFAALAAPMLAQLPATQVPDAKNLEAWLAFIRPSAEESAYEAIGWRNRFWPAVGEARRLGRPILLWTMNGHPLGCT